MYAQVANDQGREMVIKLTTKDGQVLLLRPELIISAVEFIDNSKTERGKEFFKHVKSRVIYKQTSTINSYPDDGKMIIDNTAYMVRDDIENIFIKMSL